MKANISIPVMEQMGVATLVGILPTLLLAGINSEIITIRSIILTVFCYVLLFSFIYWVFFFLHRKNPTLAGLSVVFFSFFFHSYGILYQFLGALDYFRLNHIILLSWILPISILLPWNFPDRIADKSKEIMRGISLVIITLGVFNLAMILINNARINSPHQSDSAVDDIINPLDVPGIKDTRLPDIYYLVTDETLGMNKAKDFWQLEEIDDDVAFFREQGFFVASDSKSRTLDTLQEMSSRLNILDSKGDETPDQLFDLIAENRVMAYLKRIGYTTLLIDQARSPIYYETKTRIKADYDLGYDWQSNLGFSLLSDQFFQLVAEKNMLLPLVTSESIAMQNVILHRNEIMVTYQTLADLSSYKSPKFIYAHMMVAHRPFLFDQDGSFLPLEDRLDWHNYYQSYLFQVNELKKIVQIIKSQYNENDQPIIIIQADHGARVKEIPGYPEYSIEGFPEEDKFSILNMLFLPGYDYSLLENDFDPINTFPIIFNYYFNDHIPLINHR